MTQLHRMQQQEYRRHTEPFKLQHESTIRFNQFVTFKLEKIMSYVKTRELGIAMIFLCLYCRNNLLPRSKNGPILSPTFLSMYLSSSVMPSLSGSTAAGSADFSNSAKSFSAFSFFSKACNRERKQVYREHVGVCI